MSWSDVVNNFNAIVAGLTGIGTAGGGMLFFLWRVSKWFHQMAAAETARAETMAVLSKSVESMVCTVAELKMKFDRMEKDQAKLEGKIEQTQSTLVQVIAGLQGATSSLDGMWRTLQAIFPDRVPKRASDR